MKRIFIALAACMTVLAGCSNGKLSGETESRTTGVPCTYSTLKIKGRACIVPNIYSNVVTVTADKKIVDLVKVKGNDKKLVIDATNKKLAAAQRDAIVISIPNSRRLAAVYLNGSLDLAVSDLTLFPESKFESKGSNVLKGVVTLEKCIIKSEGSDIYDIDLNCDAVRISANGSTVIGTVEHPFSVNDADVELKGSCEAYLAASGKCTGLIDGNSVLHAIGDFNYNKVKTAADGKVIQEDFLK